MIPPYIYRHYGEKLPRTVNEVNKPKKRRLARWLTLPFKDEVPSFCQACESQQLDFRPLMKKPPQFKCTEENCEENCNIVEDSDLTNLEMKNAVYINDFSHHEAEATKSHCSLCALLIGCLRGHYRRQSPDWLLYMSCICILRPRYDRVGETPKIVHRYQVWVEFEPLEGETVVDLIYVNKFRSVRKGRPVIPPIINLKIPRDWLQRCGQEHSHPAVPSALGLRMQAIINRGLFRALNTSTGSIETMTSIPKFVALSYVWGSAPDQSNYQPLESRPVSAYAPTVRDAAMIANFLGFEWLWVDRVCIDQTNRSEKAILIPYIKDIFATAQLTIVAGCGDGAQSGLLGSPGTPREAEKPLRLDSSIALLPVTSSFYSHELRSPWSKRGWTFEEFVFSKRLLFVFPSEMFFLCGTHTFRESLGCRPIIANEGKVFRGIYGEGCTSHIANTHNSIQSNPANMSEVLEVNTFMEAIREYTARELTVEADRVTAFAGVIIAALTNPVDEISERALLRHGHPLRFFEILLTWNCFGHERSFRREGDSPIIPSKPFAPSWSWASSDSRLLLNDMTHRALLCMPERIWFQYSFLHNHDILGLPTTQYNLISHMTGLKLPDELITDQPWMESLSGDLPPDREEQLSMGSSVDNLLPLPVLHLITVVFDARLVYWTDNLSIELSKPEQGCHYVLTAVDSTETSDDIYKRFYDKYMMPSWSIRSDLRPCYSPKGIVSRPLPFESFAIITGRYYYKQHTNEPCYDLYIMLLDRAGQDGTYERVGLAPFTGIKEGSYYIEVIKNGRPRWEYIRLV